uniref:Uncharacterized protein n=1 Tax=Vespula pensylvanica TaxID=30213 RepID=A0A834JTQ7_VESPE|nr:hypothetical protein H0235_017029 [Vespula pensylvanica]
MRQRGFNVTNDRGAMHIQPEHGYWNKLEGGEGGRDGGGGGEGGRGGGDGEDGGDGGETFSLCARQSSTSSSNTSTTKPVELEPSISEFDENCWRFYRVGAYAKGTYVAREGVEKWAKMNEEPSRSNEDLRSLPTLLEGSKCEGKGEHSRMEWWQKGLDFKGPTFNGQTISRDTGEQVPTQVIPIYRRFSNSTLSGVRPSGIVFSLQVCRFRGIKAARQVDRA